MRRTKLLILVLFIAAISALLVPAHFIHAQSSNSAQAIQIAPVIKELSVNRGGSYTIQLSIRNMTAKDMVFEPVVNDFRAKDESGTPRIILGEPVLPTNISMTSWVESIGPISLAANQTKIIDVRLSVPETAEPGGYYGVIRFSGAASALSGSNVSISASSGTLLLIRVNGKINEKLDIKELFTMRGSKPSKWFEKAPITFVERIYNPSNIHLKPKGEVIIKDMFGRTADTLKINQSGGNVLPLSTRRFEQSLNTKWMFGRYKAKFNLNYGTEGQALNETITFWVIPYKIVTGILLVIIVMLFGAIKLRKRTKRKEQSSKKLISSC